MLLIIFLFLLRLPTALPPLADNVPAAWRSWGFNPTPFGLSLTENRYTEVRTITSAPISPNRMLCAVFSSMQIIFFCKTTAVNADELQLPKHQRK